MSDTISDVCRHRGCARWPCGIRPRLSRRSDMPICDNAGSRAQPPGCPDGDQGAPRSHRLKSGDPLIFGRAGEEIAALQAEGIPVEIVPGISTAFALAARLKISLTHRDHAQSVRFVTGHARNGKLPANLDWHALSDPATTHIYYMAGRTAAEIAQQLIAHGMSPRTPAVVAFDVSRPGESIRRLDVGALATAINPHQLRSPVIIGVGQAFAEARKEVALAALRSDPACGNRQLRRQANLRP